MRDIPPQTHSGTGQIAPAIVSRDLNPFASLRSHWVACSLIFVAAALGFCKVALDRKQVTYTSYAAVHVARTFMRTLQNDRELELNSSWDYDSFRNDQIALILRPDVLQDALERCGQLGPPWAPANSPTSLVLENFAKEIQVSAVPKSSRIEVWLSSPQSEVPQPALEALLAAFKDAHRREYFFTEDARPQTLRTALATVEADIASKRLEIEDLTKRLKVTSFNASTGNPWTASLEQAGLALANIRREVSRAEVRRETLRVSLASPSASAELLSGGADWGELSASLQEILSPLAVSYTEFKAELAGLSPGHPGRSAIERQMRVIEDQVDQIRLRQVESQLRDADTEVREAQAAAALLQSEVAALEAGNAEFLASFQRGRILEDELPRDLSLRDRLNQRLEFFEFEAQSPSYVDISQSPSQVDLRGESNLKRNLAIALFLALMLAVGLPTLWDLRDDRIHTPNDVNRALGFPLAGWLPKRRRFGSPTLQISQTQRLAQALDRDRKRHGARIIVFTGVKGGGVLELLRALASALQGLGRRVLVVDADGTESETSGLLNLLAGERMQATRAEGGVDFLAHGRSGSGVPQWDSWSQILAAATKDYDLVLVAAPALLTAPAAETLAADADLTVLVVEAERQSLGEAARASQLLQSLKPKAVGAVLTNVKAFRSRGYYRELA